MSVESQRAMAILKAGGKLESMTNSEQKLVSALTRGGGGGGGRDSDQYLSLENSACATDILQHRMLF